MAFVKTLLANLFGHQSQGSGSTARPEGDRTTSSSRSTSETSKGGSRRAPGMHGKPKSDSLETSESRSSVSAWSWKRNSARDEGLTVPDGTQVPISAPRGMDHQTGETSNASTAEPSSFGLPSGPPGLAPNLNPTNIFNVEGLVAVITGGGTGIGLMMAKALEENGATVYIVGRRIEVVEKAALEHAKFGNIIPLRGDITDRQSLLSLVESVKARHGFIDLLVNNAAIARNLYPHPLPSPTSNEASPGSTADIKAFQDTLWNCGSPDDFEDTFATNVTAPYYTTVAFLELLHEGNVRRRCRELSQLSGSTNVHGSSGIPMPYLTSQVLTVSSSGAFRVDAKVLSPSYTLSKAAVTHLGKMMSNLLAPWAIRSNILAPGVFPSEMTVAIAPGVKLDPSVLAANVPLKRPGTAEDMAGTMLFLASRAGAYVNGAVWLVDGGRVSGISSTY